MPHRILIRQLGSARDHIAETFLARLCEWLFGAILLTLGLILLRPEQSFALSPATLPLRRIADEHWWGLYGAVVGGVRIGALVINGWVVPHTYIIRSLCSFLSVLFWFTVALGVMASGFASTMIAVYPWITLAEVVCLWRTGRDYALWRAVSRMHP